MSTRGVIAVRHGDSFAGRYHHFDSYPEGLGATLWELYHGHFGRDVAVMRRVLLDDHPAGWSTINGADWSLVAGFASSGSVPCGVCGEASPPHYAQNVLSGYELAAWVKDHGGTYLYTDHQYTPRNVPHGPQCYCHGERGEPDQEVTDSDASGCGCEYAYLLEPDALVVLSSYCHNGTKMIGMFGMGDPQAIWRPIIRAPWGGPEPVWRGLHLPLKPL